MEKITFKALCLLLVASLCVILVFPAYALEEDLDPADDNMDSEIDVSMWDEYAATEFAGGDGTEDNPYLIATPEQLALLAKTVNAQEPNYCSACYMLIKDIDLSAHSWKPIGFFSIGEGVQYMFSGCFDGGNHTIRNMTIKDRSANGTHQYYGLFGFASGTIRNLAIENAVINLNINMPSVYPLFRSIVVGTLAGDFTGKINNCTVSTNISINSEDSSVVVGGLLSRFCGVVEGASVDGSIEWNVGGGYEVGGLIGTAEGNLYASDDICEIKFSSFNGSIKGNGIAFEIPEFDGGSACLAAGGLVGYLNSLRIENCYSVNSFNIDTGGAISGLGSLFGYMNGPSDFYMKNCWYATTTAVCNGCEFYPLYDESIPYMIHGGTWGSSYVVQNCGYFIDDEFYRLHDTEWYKKSKNDKHSGATPRDSDRYFLESTDSAALFYNQMNYDSDIWRVSDGYYPCFAGQTPKPLYIRSDTTIIDSGSCTKTIRWTLFENGLLKLEGKGKVPQYNIDGLEPWYQYREYVRKVVYSNGITSTGNICVHPGLTDVFLSSTITTIEDCAFSDDQELRNITIPVGLKTIEDNAFQSCRQLKSIEIPGTVTYIVDGAFFGCSALEEIRVDAGNTYYRSWNGSLYDANLSRLIRYAGTESSPTFADSVTIIGYGAFSYNEHIEKVILPPNTMFINGLAFMFCDGLKEVVIPEKVLSIDFCAFQRCDALKQVYYLGSEDDWNKINIQDANDALINAKKVYNYSVIPEAPTAIGNHYAVTGKNKLTWEAVPYATSYKVYRATEKNGTYSLMKTTTATTYTNTTAEPGVTYYYKVKALNSNGKASPYSEIKTLTCDLAQPVVKATNVASTGYNKLTWEAIPGATAYKVYRSTSRSGTYTLMKTVRDGATSYVNTNAVNGTTYYYYVVAVMDGCAAADSAKSEIKISTCDLARPVVTGSHTDKGYNKLSWGKVEGATGYQVYRATSKTGTYSLIKTTTSTNYINTGAASGKTYYYYVVAVLDGKTAATSANSTVVALTQG